MAKGKHSVALFEVIASSKSSSRLSNLSTPKWWWKRRKQDAPAAPPPAAEPVDDTGAPAPRTPGVDLKLDPDHQRIKFNVSYSSAMVAGFTVVVVVGLSYIVGSRMSRGPSPAVAGSTEQVRQGPVAKGVLDLVPPPAVARTQTQSTPPSAAQANNNTPPATAATPLATETPSPQDRIVRMNYLIVQSYPSEQVANEVRDFLGQNGIPCTVEKGPREWAPMTMYSVVTVRGFERPRTDPAYEPFKQSILAAGKKITKNPKFTELDPQPYSWRVQTSR